MTWAGGIANRSSKPLFICRPGQEKAGGGGEKGRRKRRRRQKRREERGEEDEGKEEKEEEEKREGKEKRRKNSGHREKTALNAEVKKTKKLEVNMERINWFNHFLLQLNNLGRRNDLGVEKIGGKRRRPTEDRSV